MKKEYVRRFVVFENHFIEFKKTLSRDALKKMYQVLTLIQEQKMVSTKFLAPVVGRKGLFEIRIEYESNIYRVFCCFDSENMMVLFNGFQKKTQKTPVEQLDRAELLMMNYYELKKQRENG